LVLTLVLTLVLALLSKWLLASGVIYVLTDDLTLRLNEIDSTIMVKRE